MFSTDDDDDDDHGIDLELKICISASVDLQQIELMCEGITAGSDSLCSRRAASLSFTYL